MSGGIISGNNGGNYGGGVAHGGSGVCKFTMSGGGVYVKTVDTFTQTGGTVSGNTPDDVYHAP